MLPRIKFKVLGDKITNKKLNSVWSIFKRIRPPQPDFLFLAYKLKRGATKRVIMYMKIGRQITKEFFLLKAEDFKVIIVDVKSGRTTFTVRQKEFIQKIKGKPIIYLVFKVATEFKIPDYLKGSIEILHFK